MKILIIGASGLVGNSLYKLLQNKGAIGTAFKNLKDDLIKLDMTSLDELNTQFKDIHPNIVFLPAFIPGVDYCELNDEPNKINLQGINNVVEICKKFNSKLVFYSTDYVFDGISGPYLETDKANPINKYGNIKLLCEEMVKSLNEYLIIRTTVVYGYNPTSKNFLMTFTDDLLKGIIRKVPSDQFGSPTYVDDLAKISINLVEMQKKGLYNIAGPDFCSRYVFALKIARIFGLNEDLIEPVPTSLLNQPAKRPLRAGLIIDKIRTEINANPSGIDNTLKTLKNKFIK